MRAGRDFARFGAQGQRGAGEYGFERMTRRVASTDEPDEPTQSGTVLVAVDGSESEGACCYSVRSR
jgi:hypothetical protein